MLGTQQQQEVHNIPTSIYPTKKSTRIIFGSCEERQCRPRPGDTDAESEGRRYRRRVAEGAALQAEGMKDYRRHHHHLPTSTRYTSEDLNLN